MSARSLSRGLGGSTGRDASAPPAIITSASPYSIMRPASPMQCELVVHAETIETLGPLALNWIEIIPATMLMMVPGTKKGDRRRGPLAIISRMLSLRSSNS